VPGPVLRVREVLRRDQLNEADYERRERGYYERLLDEGRQFGDLERTSPGQSALNAEAAPFDAGPLCLTVDDLREYVLKPNLSVWRGSVRWTTNYLGMRDRSYATVRPAHCVRIALIGDSIGAGWGVDDGQGFEPLLERSLDQRSRSVGGPSVEILNFAVPGHAPGQRWENFRRVGWALEPGLVIYEATLADPGWDERRLRGLLPRGLGWNSPLYHDALARAGVQPGGDSETYKQALRRSRWDILAGVYRMIAADCRARGVPAIWVLIPRVGKATSPAERDRLIDLARRSGFSEVLDLTGTFDGLDPETLAINPDDYHPNAGGHARLARSLEVALTARAELRRLLEPAGDGGDAP